MITTYQIKVLRFLSIINYKRHCFSILGCKNFAVGIRNFTFNQIENRLTNQKPPSLGFWMEFKFKGALSDLGQFLEGKIPLKNDKIFLLFHVQSLLFLRYSIFLIIYGNDLIRKLRIMTSQTDKQIITVLILSNISRSIGNPAMNFGQLREHKVKNIFL